MVRDINPESGEYTKVIRLETGEDPRLRTSVRHGGADYLVLRKMQRII
jgi:hypothetical protein